MLERVEDDEEGCFLVFFDFTGKISQYFYKNLERIQKRQGDGKKVQFSVLECTHLRTAKVIALLAQHYEGEVLIYKNAEKVHLPH